jgi:hypothetical protein
LIRIVSLDQTGSQYDSEDESSCSIRFFYSTRSFRRHNTRDSQITST